MGVYQGTYVHPLLVKKWIADHIDCCDSPGTATTPKKAQMRRKIILQKMPTTKVRSKSFKIQALLLPWRFRSGHYASISGTLL